MKKFPFALVFVIASGLLIGAVTMLLVLQRDAGFIKDSCGEVTWSRGSLPIPVYVDVGASSWFASIEDARALWDPNGELFEQAGVFIDTATVTDPVIIIRAEPIDEHGKSRLRWNARCELRRVDMTLPDLIEKPFVRRRAVAHEFGHALGFDHDTIGTSVMFPKVLEILPFEVTDGDRRRASAKYGTKF